MLGEKLRQYRKARGWKQEDLAERSGYSRSSIINWENGKRAPRTVDIDKLAMVLGISPRDLLNNDIDPTKSDIQQELASPLPDFSLGATKGYAYWGGVLDNSLKLAESRDLQEIQLVVPLLRLAYETLVGVIEKSASISDNLTDGVSAYNGNNSTYSSNTLNIGKVTT